MSNNKIAFITGCAGDLGIEIAKKLIQQNYKLICQIRKTNAKFEKFKNQYKKNILSIQIFDLLEEKKNSEFYEKNIEKI